MNFFHPLYFALLPQGATITSRGHGPDLSKYDVDFDPDTTDKQLDFVFQRASYGVTQDERFQAIWQGVQKVPIRMAYHYLSSHINWKTQADAFLSYVAGLPFHAFVCDWEGAFNDLTTGFAKMGWDWCNYVQEKTGKPVILYTSLSLYNQYIGPSETVYGIDWDRFAYWQAQWFLTPNPNGTPTMPTKRTGGWQFWQYTDKGSGYGTGRNYPTDLNVFNGSVEQLRAFLGLGAEPPPPPPTSEDVVTHPFAGVTNIRGVRDGWRFSLLICDPSKVRYEAVHPIPRTIGTVIAAQTGAEIVLSGGEWSRETGVPRDYSVANGQVYIPRRSFVPSFMALEDGSLRIYHENIPNVKQAISGLRYLVLSGLNVIPPDGTDPKYTEGHSRRVDGLNGSGFGMHLTSEGAYPNQGWKLYTAAELMKQYGAVIAFDEGGGGDATEVIDGALMNVPEDISNGIHVQRALPQFLTIHAEESGAMGDYYEYTATGNRAIRTGAAVTYPRIASHSDLLNGTKARGGATPDDRVTLANDLYSGGNLVGKTGDVWVRVYDNNGQAVVGWTALKHMGQLQLTERLVTTEPPPPPVSETVIDAVLTEKDLAGNVTATYKGTLTKQ